MQSMPEFSYVGMDVKGSHAEGHISAESREQAMSNLRQRGITPLEVVQRQNSGSPLLSTLRMGGGQRAKALTQDQILEFVKELGSLLRAGLPLDRSLRVLSQTQTHGGLQALQQQLLDAVKAGRSLSLALAAHPDSFGPLHVNLIRAGEVSGKLSQALLYLAEHLERGKALRSSLVSALTYPAILLVTALLSVALMLGFVVPQFKPLFSDLGDRLPFLTHLVVVAGDFLVSNGWVLLLTLGGGGWMVSRWWATDAGRQQKERGFLAVPVLGRLLLTYQLGQFTRTLGTLLANGVGLIQAVSIATGGVSYVSLQLRLGTLSEAIKQGQKFTRALTECQLFDPASLQLIAVGEETGRLDEMLLELTKRYEERVQLQTRRALTLLEPVLILGLGVIVAAIIIAILLGILSVNELVA
jgi:general secretion pathway protein F